MDLKQLEYIIAIAEEQSISKAAEKLYVTQSALNQQLLRLERELGVKLFHRIRHTMVPTYAGNVYLDAARKIMGIKEETYKMLSDIADMKRGEISISYTPERGSEMFARVYPKFHKKYPDISFRVIEARAVKMTQLLGQGSISLALTAHSDESRNPQFDYFPIDRELLVLALPRTHPLAYMAGERSWETFPFMDLKLLREDEFVLLSRETMFRRMLDKQFMEAGYKPKVLFEATTTYTAVNMAKSQIGPAFFPQSYVDPEAPLVYFSIGKHLSWNRSIAYRKGTYLSKVEMDFMNMVKEDLTVWRIDGR